MLSHILPAAVPRCSAHRCWQCHNSASRAQIWCLGKAETSNTSPLPLSRLNLELLLFWFNLIQVLTIPEGFCHACTCSCVLLGMSVRNGNAEGMGALLLPRLLSQLCTMICGCSGVPQTPPLAAGTCSTSGEVLRVGLKGQHLMSTDKWFHTLYAGCQQLCRAIPAILSISQLFFFNFPLHPQPLCTSRQQRRWLGQKNSSLGCVWRAERAPAWHLCPLRSTKAAELGAGIPNAVSCWSTAPLMTLLVEDN